MLIKKLNALLTGSVCLFLASFTGTAVAADAPVIRFATGVDAAFTPVFLAQYEKLFEKAGLNVQLQQYANSNEGLDAMNAGLADLVGAAEPGTLTRIVHGDVRPLAIFEQSGKYIKLVVRSGINDVKEIKKFGMVKGSVSEYSTQLLLSQYQIDPKSVELIPAGPPELPALLVGSNIDAYFAWEPWPSIGIKQGAKILTTSGDVGYTYTMWLTANGKWLDKNAGEAKKVLGALAEACKIIRDGAETGDVSRAAAANKALAKLPPEQTAAFLKDVECQVRDFTPADVESFDRIATFLHDRKMTPVKADFRKVMQFGFVKE